MSDDGPEGHVTGDPAYEDAAKHGVGTCVYCGEDMLFNVPRMGASGGFVHKSTMDVLCKNHQATLLESFQRHSREIMAAQTVLDEKQIFECFVQALKAGDFVKQVVAGPGPNRQSFIYQPYREAEELRAKYHELIMAVGKKYECETRHETALRYIREAEKDCVGGPCEEKSPEGGIMKRGAGERRRHRAFWISTPQGNEARILGDPKIPAKAKRALAAMIDQVAKNAREGKL